jgi:hypothetical protein
MYKHVKFAILAGLMVLSILAVLPAAAPAVQTEVQRTVESYTCQSAHPYVNSYDYTWTITKSGATQIRVYFEYIATEANYDYVYVLTSSGTQLHKISGSQSAYWSSYATGDTIKIRLTSDSSVTGNGFKITQIDYVAGSGGGSGVLTNGVASTGSIAVVTTEYDYWSLAVAASATSMHVVVDCGSNDFDLFASNTVSTPTHTSMVFEGYTSGGEDVTYASPAAGTWYFGVNSYSGTGSYTITVTVTYGTAPPPPTGNVLTSGVASTGSLAAAGAQAVWTITVGSGATQMYSVLTCGSADYDLYGKLGSEPTTSSYTWRGYTSGGEEVTYANPGAGTWYVMVRSYSGTGSYSLTVTITTATADTTAPTVSITSPTNGAEVSGTVTVQVAASDNVGVTSRAISIDGAAYTTTLTWATTAVADGSHTIVARATDAAGNNGYSSTITVTVKNTVTPPPSGNVLTSGVAATGSLAAVGATFTYTMVVEANCVSMYAVLTCGSADFDLYGKLGSAPTLSSYGWRGYTSGGEEVTTANPGAGTWYIMVQSYSGTGAYSLTVTLTYGTAPPPPPPGGDGKYALLVGISNYKAINDLNMCDEDANDWYNYLVNSMGYPAANIVILGDGSSTYAKTPAGKATEANYKYYLNWLAGLSSAAEIAFITSGHGAGDGAGSSYLCAWDCGSGESGEDGDFYDTEIANILKNALAPKIFVFIDHCYSGGLGPELMAMANKAAVYCTTTCTANGYGYDEATNGAWTFTFLETTLIGQYGSSPSTTMETAFDYASTHYNHSGGDAPMEFDGSTSTSFTL